MAFVYETGDAAGQNMTTACTWACCQWLNDQMKHLDGVQIDDFLIEGNMSGDKKVTFQSFIAGRGIRVTAEAVITTSVLAEVLKVTPEQIVRGHVKCMVGPFRPGWSATPSTSRTPSQRSSRPPGRTSPAFTSAAWAICRWRSCPMGSTSLLLPALVVGTVGGGTHLPAQRALLEMLGCVGDGSVARLAENHRRVRSGPRHLHGDGRCVRSVRQRA